MAATTIFLLAVNQKMHSNPLWFLVNGTCAISRFFALRAFLIACCAWASLGDSAQAGEFVLIENGAGPAPVIVFKDAPPRTRAAAVELCDYVQKITGARPDLIEGEPNPIPPRAVWVGLQPAVRKLLPKLDLDFKHPEEILLACSEHHLVIAGRDRRDPQHLDVQTHDGTVKGKQQEYGTVNAVYCRRGFGPAADAVRAYFEQWEQARTAYVAEHGHAAGVFSLPRLYTPQRLDQAQAHLDSAAKCAASAAPIYRRRVEFVRAGLDYTRLQAQNAALMRRYWLKSDDAIAAQVRKNWQAIEALCREHPLALNWGPLRPGTPRMLGLHPDHPNPKIKLSQLKELGLE